MDPSIYFALLYPLLGAAAAFLAYRKKSRQSLVPFWQADAASCGLEVVETGPPLRARAGPVEVRLDAFGSNGRDTQITIMVPGLPDFSQVRILPVANRPHRYPFEPGIKTGEFQFDQTFYSKGPVPLVLALLDARTRQLLLQVNAKSPLEISRGEIRTVVYSWQTSHTLSLLLQAGQRLAQIVDVWQRLAENARQDPEIGVRRQNLLLLIQDLPGHPVTLEALRAACSDRSHQIRVQAAQELGAEGRDLLLSFAESTEDDNSSAQTIAYLGREAPFERMNALLSQALRRRRLQTARACLEVLGQSGDTASIEVLAKVLALEQGKLAVTAAQALGATGSPAAEPSLLLALQREQTDLQLAVANALGRVGSAAAVLPLQEVAASATLKPELRRAVRQAIAEIQSRLPEASPGQLSMTETEAGQLSLATDPAGQLSLPPDEARRGAAPDV